MAKHYVSPIGLFEYPWVNRADTQYNADGIFHVKLILSVEEAEGLKAQIDAASLSAFEKETDKLTPGEKKKWNVFYPYQMVEDAEGNETGEIKFTFKQNRKFTGRDGKEVIAKITIRDSNDVVRDDLQVFNGSEGRIRFSMRPIKMTSDKKAGVRLDFSAVQVTKLQSGGGGFGKVEGGYVAEGRDSDESDAGQEAGEY